jgi:hypothetical protein
MIVGTTSRPGAGGKLEAGVVDEIGAVLDPT